MYSQASISRVSKKRGQWHRANFPRWIRGEYCHGQRPTLGCVTVVCGVSSGSPTLTVPSGVVWNTEMKRDENDNCKSLSAVAKPGFRGTLACISFS